MPTAAHLTVTGASVLARAKEIDTAVRMAGKVGRGPRQILGFDQQAGAMLRVA
jgi:hypothetical protein